MNVVYLYIMKILLKNKNQIFKLEWQKKKPLRIECFLNSKTIFGVSKTLCDIVEKVSERIITSGIQTPYFREYETTSYKMSCYKSCTNYYFLLMTSKKQVDYSSLLKEIYIREFIPLIKKNILFNNEDYINLPQFNNKVRERIQNFYKIQFK